MATSLATAYDLGTVTGYGIRATSLKLSRMVMRNVRLNPPSASFSKRTMWSGPRLTDSAASRDSASMLKTRLRSS